MWENDGEYGETPQSVWIQDRHQCGVPFSLMLIEEKVENFYEDLKKHNEESEGISFNVSLGWFHQFRAKARLHNMKISGQVVSTDMVATWKFPDSFCEITDEGMYFT